MCMTCRQGGGGVSSSSDHMKKSQSQLCHPCFYTCDAWVSLWVEATEDASEKRVFIAFIGFIIIIIIIVLIVLPTCSEFI